MSRPESPLTRASPGSNRDSRLQDAGALLTAADERPTEQEDTKERVVTVIGAVVHARLSNSRPGREHQDRVHTYFREASRRLVEFSPPADVHTIRVVGVSRAIQSPWCGRAVCAKPSPPALLIRRKSLRLDNQTRTSSSRASRCDRGSTEPPAEEHPFTCGRSIPPYRVQGPFRMRFSDS